MEIDTRGGGQPRVLGWNYEAEIYTARYFIGA